MEPYKLHLKIGLHEFSAEGPAEVVKQDFEIWKSLINDLPAQSAQPTLPEKNGKAGADTNALTKEQTEKIYLLDDKRDMLSLRILPRSDDRYADALLLVVLGHKIIKGMDEIMVTQLKPAMRQSGCLVERIDQVAAKYVRQGYLNKGGMGKGGRYSLTNSGIEKATALLSNLASS
ncbi:MAG TPA: hypothetical protein VK302_08975 [Terriglobales bacterium]|nr:hypothetical protein [Terriglobales bacterium]